MTAVQTKPAAEETKTQGASRDFTGTWLAQVRVPSLLSDTLDTWCDRTFVNEEHLWRSSNTKVAKGGIVKGPREISVLLGIPHAPTNALVHFLAGHTRPFEVKFGSVVKCFEREHDAASNQDYHVLYAEVDAPYLHDLQNTIGVAAAPYGGSPLKWHFPKYNPHVTLAFVRAEFVHLYVGRAIELTTDADREGDSAHYTTSFILKKFQDKSVTPVTIYTAAVADEAQNKAK